MRNTGTGMRYFAGAVSFYKMTSNNLIWLNYTVFGFSVGFACLEWN